MTATAHPAKLRIAGRDSGPVGLADVSLRGAAIIADGLTAEPGDEVELVVRHEKDELKVEGRIAQATPTGALVAFTRLSPQVLAWVTHRIDEQKRGRWT